MERTFFGPPLFSSGVELLAAAAQFSGWALKAGLVKFIWEPADPTLRQLANINVLLFRLNDTQMAHYEALADIHAHLEQQAEEPLLSPEATPTVARLYQTTPPPEAENENPGAAPPHQPEGQTFTDLFKKKK